MTVIDEKIPEPDYSTWDYIFPIRFNKNLNDKHDIKFVLFACVSCALCTSETETETETDTDRRTDRPT